MAWDRGRGEGVSERFYGASLRGHQGTWSSSIHLQATVALAELNIMKKIPAKFCKGPGSSVPQPIGSLLSALRKGMLVWLEHLGEQLCRQQEHLCPP